jgi:hypothetical protein
MMKVMPHIYRSWDTRKAVFVWTWAPPPEGKWGFGVSQQARYDWNRAIRWCHQQNAKAAG